MAEVSISIRHLLDAWAASKHLLSDGLENGGALTTPRDFFEGIVPESLDAIGRCLPVDVVVAFHIDGADGGHWELQKGEAGSTLGPAGAGRKDCEVWCDSQIFMRLVRGTLPSSRAFLSGELRVAGDIGLALALEGALNEAA